MRKGFINKRKFDIFILFIIISMVFIGILLDMEIIKNLPSIILINNDMRKDIMLYVFAAQVSVSTLGITVISILGGIAKDTIYGISISQYLMEDRPLIFKHKVNITIQLMLIVFSYIFMSLGGYNFLVCIFFISIIIVWIMAWDVFAIFYGKEYIRENIYGYFIEMFSKKKHKKNDKRKTLINGIKNDALIAIDINNTVTLKENLNLFNDILSQLSLNTDDKSINKILDQFEDDLSDIFNKIFKEGDTNKSIIALENIQTLYKRCNEINNNTKYEHLNIYLNILDNVARYFFTSIANIITLESDDYHILFSLQQYMYGNLYFKNVGCRSILNNNTYLNIYSVRIYYEILNKGSDKYNSKRLFYIKKKLYKDIEMLISFNNFNEFKKEKIEQLYIQLYEYTKVLIDNGEKQVLKETLFEFMDKIEYKDNENDVEYIFIILIYLYYIINFETLVDDKLKSDSIDLINLSNDKVKYFLLSKFGFNFSEEFIQKSKRILGKWEIMPEYEAKCLIIDDAIEEFIIFYIVQDNWDIDNLTNQLRPLVQEKEFSMYMNINRDKNIMDRYTSFVNIFFNEDISREQVEEKISMLKFSIINLYKESEIRKSKENIKTEEYYNNIKEQIKNVCIQNIKDKTEIFNNTEPQKVINTTITLLRLETEIQFINESKVNSDISSFNNTFLTKSIIEIIKERLLKNISFNGDKEMLLKFFDLKQNLAIDVDTLIGYRNVFYSSERDREFDFREFEKDKFKIKAQYCNSCIVAIDSTKFYFKVKNILVKIEHFDINQIYKNLEQNQKGEYLYNITNDIYLPFSKEELKQYISNRKRFITVEADIEYGFTDDLIGLGVFIGRKK